MLRRICNGAGQIRSEVGIRRATMGLIYSREPVVARKEFRFEFGPVDQEDSQVCSIDRSKEWLCEWR